MRIGVIVLAIAGFAVTAHLAAVPQPGGALKIGDVAPAFSLAGSDGRQHSLAEFKGKKAVVLAWFPKAFTGG